MLTKNVTLYYGIVRFRYRCIPPRAPDRYQIPGSTKPARHENIPGGKIFLRPSMHCFPSGCSTSMMTTGSGETQTVKHPSPELQRSCNAAVTCPRGGNRCYGRPGDSCSLLSNRSSCSRPLLLWCRCRRSGRSGNGCATRGPIGPGPPHLCE